jgi:hypothetical protein
MRPGFSGRDDLPYGWWALKGGGISEPALSLAHISGRHVLASLPVTGSKKEVADTGKESSMKAFGILGLVLTGIVAVNIMPKQELRLLRQAEMECLRGGGVTLCEDTECYCDCEWHPCETLDCSPCEYYDGTSWQVARCKGKSGNTNNIYGCYSDNDPIESCGVGNDVETDCVAQGWVGKTSCSGPPDVETTWMENECW